MVALQWQWPFAGAKVRCLPVPPRQTSSAPQAKLLSQCVRQIILTLYVHAKDAGQQIKPLLPATVRKTDERATSPLSSRPRNERYRQDDDRSPSALMLQL